jgi:hypothetical protein
MLPEIEEWCQQTYGRVPKVFFVDGTDHDRQSCWTIWFDGNEEAIAFKLRWSSYEPQKNA